MGLKYVSLVSTLSYPFPPVLWNHRFRGKFNSDPRAATRCGEDLGIKRVASSEY
jgi:hypothetical protein